MKMAGIAVVITVLGSNVWADDTPPPTTALAVCIGGRKNLELVGRAEAIASKIFAKIGVRIEWRELSNCPPRAIQIQLSEKAPEGQLPSALAYAHPFDGTRITVFLDRVKDVVAPPTVPYLLGHVIAHEVGHILQGMTRHSETGVMKAHWSREDYHRMTWQPLDFTEQDIALIKRGLQARAAIERAE